ncbi:RIP metalloprotease RseP [candidate division WOR-1 bacterium RIFCSPHIGHO2_01_FULL_53_15]|uniref:Zinc metalloprotease n=1 Tax=candidate division WOR-1 bacterium RIFCSPHIGHO2_01_FULL_53_15 TaxID=1802564 RepID=A0A1F4PZ96_UNCSA|nr:MAG: RIP metalloprotease RseP [candidate division WOR-1 bacterium RIFCSPHIGHO2_01_FULL_53_15]OGC10616.1 MAG: RIP metalloprotease RseP [candidate division WOR-1 bacterium RIFCSPHIGHO2_02_FULL_53_26]
MLTSVVAFIIVFTILAVAHELGHLIWAKRAGIRVFEFGLGFGPRLFAFRKKETVYSLNLVPILAFVRIAGEGETDEDKACPENEKYQAKTPWQKFKTLVAGPAMNLVVALIILILMSLVVGVPTGASFEIASVNKDQPAALAGIKAGDKLLTINSRKFKKMEEAVEFIHKSPRQPLTLLIERGGERLKFKATPRYNEKLKVGLLGFTPKLDYLRTNPLRSIYYGIEQTVSLVLLTLIIVGKLITGGVSLADLAGPVGIAQITGKYAQTGLVSLLYFTAFLNINVGVLNLLPIPALDGGRIVFVIIEWLRKKPLDPRLENKINYWGFVVLLALMALVSAHDILRLFRGQ